MKIEIILVFVIGLIFLFDFFKNKKSSVEVVVNKTVSKKKIRKIFVFISMNILISFVLGIYINFLFHNPYTTKVDILSLEYLKVLITEGYFTQKGTILNFSLGLVLSTIFFLLTLLISKIIIISDSTLLKFSNFITKRKKNIALSIISIPLLKVLIHFFFYPERISNNGISRTKDFGYHINLIFEEHLLLFIPSLFLVLFFAWFFNDKIKAR